MTRVYINPSPAAPGTPQTRALIVGAGRYPHAQNETAARPKLNNLESVGPSIWTFVERLLKDWKNHLEGPLASVDLLLSEPAHAGGSAWPGYGVQGEVVAGTVIDEPTLTNIDTALTASLSGAGTQDHFLFLCCGHGFWKTKSFFIPSDFGASVNNPWASVIDLDGFRLGLSQKQPRFQWLFFDCCRDLPDTVLSTLSPIGNPLLQANAEELVKANRFGDLCLFGLSSAAAGRQAFGIPGQPSRFCEMLMEALDGTGAISKRNGRWHVDDRGIMDAIRSYAQRNPQLPDPDFYKAAFPISSDMPQRMRFRSVAGEPKSRFIAFSAPRAAMRTADVAVRLDGNPAPLWSQTPAGKSKLLIEIPARLSCKVSVAFSGGKTREIEVYGTLPTAEPDEMEFKA